MKVFITHSHGNRPLVRQVVKTLKQAGLDVWDDEYDTYPSDNWAKVTGEALEQSDALVVLITPDALDSVIVHRDIGYSLTNIQFEYRVIPVLIGVERSVQSIKTDVRVRVDAANGFGNAQPQPQSRVHRDRYADELRALYFLLVEAFDRDIHRLGLVPRAPQKSHRHG